MRYQFQMGPYFVFTFKRNSIWLRLTEKNYIFSILYGVSVTKNSTWKHKAKTANHKGQFSILKQ